jgi:hypothetical protein
VLGTPGARVIIATSNAMTIGGNYTPNIGLHGSAVQLITRASAMPEDQNGRPMDLAEDVMLVTDPVSGITFEVALYREYRQMMYTVALAWGATAIKPDFIATLMG